MNLWDNNANELLYLCFNQNYACFAGGTNSGFFAYNNEPFTETTRKEFSTGGIGIIEMCYRTNILALVGGGKYPRYPTNKVMMWDDTHNRCIGELSFPTDVKGVKLRRDTVVVVLEKAIYIYNFQDLKLLEQRKTIQNPNGLCALCPHPNHKVMAYPGKERGVICIELFDYQRQVIIPAHESELMALTLSSDGSLVASASERGTLIRVFSTNTGNMVHELRRGAERAVIHSICFNASSTYLACSSDKGTIHVFSLLNDPPQPASQQNTGQQQNTIQQQGQERANVEQEERASGRPPAGSFSNSIRNALAPSSGGDSDSSLSSAFTGLFKKVMPKYFASRWSIAQYRIQETRTICAFGTQKNSLIIIGADGSFHKVLFDPTGSTECEKVKFFKFLSKPNSENQ